MEFFSNFFVFDPQRPLIFTDSIFWIFFAAVLGIYSLIYKKFALRSLFLFVASLFFYYKSSGFYFSLLIFSTFVDYFIGFGIYNAKEKLHKKLLVALSVTINLGLLGYFKYSYFLVDILNSTIIPEGQEMSVVNVFHAFANNMFGKEFSIDEIILPVGISFYTFQTISYSIDIYRERLTPVKNIIDFGFYVSFFPQLVAGPIVRAAEFIPQIHEKYSLSKDQFNRAVFLVINGLFKKMIISDYISINFVDRVFTAPESYTGFENLMAVYGYAIQIYCDFSGYTDIAIGVALLLGFNLPLNFNSPYKAANITDFWRRWHISLSSWLKDYLYISLGGNRKGKARQYVNLALTMLLGGLWHGAAFRFIIWGGLHGAGLALHKMWMQYVPLAKSKNQLIRFVSILITFHFVCYAWIFFRAKSLDHVNIVLHQIFFNFRADKVVEIMYGYRTVFMLILLGFYIHWLPVHIKEWYQKVFSNTPLWLKAAVCVFTAVIVYQAKSADSQPFIYFQF